MMDLTAKILCVLLRYSLQATHSTYGRYRVKYTSPPHAAARLAREKNVLMRKQSMMVAVAKAVRKKKITAGSLYGKISPTCMRENHVKL